MIRLRKEKGDLSRDDSFNWSDIVLFLTVFFGTGIILVLFIKFVDAIIGTNLLDGFNTAYEALILDAIVFLFILLIYKKARRFILAQLDFSVLLLPRTYLYVGFGFFLFILTQYLLINLFHLDSTVDQTESLGIDAVNNLTQQLLLFTSVAILTPVKEELLYRGLIYHFLENKYNAWTGIIISSIIFGLLHFGYPLSATFMGLVFAILYRATNSIITPMLLHVIWNLFVVSVITLSV